MYLLYIPKRELPGGITNPEEEELALVADVPKVWKKLLSFRKVAENMWKV